MNELRIHTLAAHGDTDAMRELMRLTWRRGDTAGTQRLLDQLGAVEARAWALHALDWRSVRVSQDYATPKCSSGPIVDLVPLLRLGSELVTLEPVRVPLLWSEAIARAVAADWAERAIGHAESALRIFEKKRPGDERPRRAIEAARAAVIAVRSGDREAAEVAWAAYAAANAHAAVEAAWGDAEAAYAAASASEAAYAAHYAAASASPSSSVGAASSSSAAHAARARRLKGWQPARATEREHQAARLWQYLIGEVTP